MAQLGFRGAAGVEAHEGLEAERVIREELPGTAIIVLSADVAVNGAMDLPVGGWYPGYRLKTRVTDVTEITETAGQHSLLLSV
jgi:hypothetical protein